MRAVISVSNKTGLADFVGKLAGVQVYSTGGTKKVLEDAGIDVHGISDLTGFPEILDGRVKTLHPHVHGGLLTNRAVPEHMAEIAKLGIEPIDMVVVNLYPFMETVAKDGVTLDEALENIDIGGPTMIRAAAKNFPGVLVVTDPADYGWVAERLGNGGLSLEERRGLAQKAFQHVALYDTAIATYLRGDGDPLSEEFTIGLSRIQSLRYGENPHQQGDNGDHHQQFYQRKRGPYPPFRVRSINDFHKLASFQARGCGRGRTARNSRVRSPVRWSS